MLVCVCVCVCVCVYVCVQTTANSLYSREGTWHHDHKYNMTMSTYPNHNVPIPSRYLVQPGTCLHYSPHYEIITTIDTLAQNTAQEQLFFPNSLGWGVGSRGGWSWEGRGRINSTAQTNIWHKSLDYISCIYTAILHNFHYNISILGCYCVGRVSM